VAQLAGKGVDIRALTRTPEKARSPHGVVPVKGDQSDVDAMRDALTGVSTVFLLVPNVPIELTQALQASLAHSKRPDRLAIGLRDAASGEPGAGVRFAGRPGRGEGHRGLCESEAASESEDRGRQSERP
jgi:uncharacterized protein YbjT (DUF2867 family)